MSRAVPMRDGASGCRRQHPRKPAKPEKEGNPQTKVPSRGTRSLSIFPTPICNRKKTLASFSRRRVIDGGRIANVLVK